MRRELSSVNTVAGGTTYVLTVLPWVSDADVSVCGVRRTHTQYQGVLQLRATSDCHTISSTSL